MDAATMKYHYNADRVDRTRAALDAARRSLEVALDEYTSAVDTLLTDALNYQPSRDGKGEDHEDQDLHLHSNG